MDGSKKGRGDPGVIRQWKQNGSKMMCSRTIKRRRTCIAFMALCGAVAATSVRSSVRMWSCNHEWWDHDVNGFSRTEFSQIFRMILTVTLAMIRVECLFKVRLHFKKLDEAENHILKWPKSDLKGHISCLSFTLLLNNQIWVGVGGSQRQAHSKA